MAARDSRNLAFIALMLGALGIAFAPVLAKLAVLSDAGATRAESLSPVATAFWRMGLGAPVFGIFWALRGRRDPSSKSMSAGWKMLLLPGFFFALDLGFWHWSFEFTSVANATLEANFAVVLVAATSWLWLKEKFSWLFPVGAALAFVGMVLLVGANFGAGGDAWIGDLLGLSVAVFYAGYQLSTKIMVGRYPVYAVMTIVSATTALFLLVGVALIPGRLIPSTMTGWAYCIALALVSQVFGQGLIAYGMSRLPAGLASVVLILQPVLAAFLGWIFLSQPLTQAQGAAGLLVISGIYLAKRGSLR